ncbi:MAG: hypothetical protein D6725_15915 [Planctomycetota bacterium]|nr:MAG: hypothetical protein D6725_15915 [Planctomycetota bacterium]
MDQKKLDEVPLLDRFAEVERMTREAIDHWENNFAPKTHALYRIVRRRGARADEIEDSTVRNHAREVMQSYEFGMKLFQKMDEYFLSINKSVEQIIQEADLT